MSARESREEIRRAAERDPRELEREANDTRERISRTIDQMSSRLTPGQLVDRAMNFGGGPASEFATNLNRSVRNNPLPVILTSVGVGWLVLSDSDRAPEVSTGDGGTQRLKDRAGDAKDRTGERLRSGREASRNKAGEVGSEARDAVRSTRARAGESASALAEQGSRRRAEFERLLHDQPLVVGALALAFGAALSASLPASRTENRAMGPVGDRTREKAEEKGREALQGAANAAESARNKSTSDTASSEARPA